MCSTSFDPVEEDKRNNLSVEFRKQYLNNADQYAYLSTLGENNDCPKMNYDRMVKCRENYYLEIAQNKADQRRDDILKGEEQTKMRKEADAVKHQENSRAAQDPSI